MRLPPPDLLALVHAAELAPADQAPTGATPVSRAALQADRANAQARNARLVARIQQLEKRLSEALGEQVWRESSLGAPADVEELQRTISRLAVRRPTTGLVEARVRGAAGLPRGERVRPVGQASPLPRGRG